MVQDYKVPTGVTEEGTLLEGLRCGFGGSANQRGSVGTRGLPTLPRIQRVAEAFRTAPCRSTAEGREKKSLRRGLNPSQSLFGRLSGNKSLLVFLGRTQAGFHSLSPTSSVKVAVPWQSPCCWWQRWAVKDPSSTACDFAAAKRTVKQALPLHSGPWITPLGYGQGKRGKVSWSFHPTRSWLQLPVSSECGLKGQFGDPC